MYRVFAVVRTSFCVPIPQPAFQREHPPSSHTTNPAQVHNSGCISDPAKNSSSEPPTWPTWRVQVRPGPTQSLPPHPWAGWPRVQHRLAAVRVAAAPPVPSRQPNGASLHPGPRVPFRSPPSIHCASLLFSTQVWRATPLCVGTTFICRYPSTRASTWQQQNPVAHSEAAHASWTCDSQACGR